MNCDCCPHRSYTGETGDSYCFHPEVPYSKEDVSLWGRSDAPHWCPLLPKQDEDEDED